MHMWWPLRGLTRIWEWAMPGLISLEPAAMALYETSRAMGTASKQSADFPTVLMHVVRDPLPGDMARNQLRVEGFEK
jgi:hypothetical protein